jgi:DNA-binding IclR family transcriptional regulator
MARPRNAERVDVLLGVERAATLLQRFTLDKPVVDLRQTAKLLDIPRSTAHRLLRSLEAGGFLIYEAPRQTYRLSLAVARLGHVALAGVDLRLVARPHLHQLVDKIGESAFLLVVEKRSAVVIDIVASDAPLRLTFPVGTPWPLHAGAANKVLLAHLPEETVAEVLSGSLPRITSRTITDPHRLRAELALIRRRGFAYSVGELTPQIAGVAVPILGAGQLMGALAVAGPASRLTAARIPQSVTLLKQAAHTMTHALEGTGNHHKRRRWKE